MLGRVVGIVRHVAELLKIRSDPGLFAAVDHAAVATGHLAAAGFRAGGQISARHL